MSEDGDGLVSNLLVKYEKQSAIRALVQLIPLGIGGAADTFVATRAARIKEDRARAFFDELEEGATALTPEIIETEDFLHCFFATTNAALKTRRREKIQLFARLLRSSIGDNPPRSTDDFEDMLATLDETNYTEWCALKLLDEYSSHPREASQNDLQWSLTFWGEFRERAERELNIPTAEFLPFMNRISRTGLYEQFVGGFWDYDGGVGMLTPRFHRLKSFVDKQDQHAR